MKKGHKPFAAILRQLHHLEKQAKQVSETHGTRHNRRELILKFRALLRKLRTALHSKWWLRPAICIALYLQISIGEVTGQQFAEPVINPFGIENPKTLLIFKAVDIDDDGDNDILGFGYDSNSESDSTIMQYFENIGTASNNSFAPPVNNAFGIDLTGLQGVITIDFGDLDNDGDYDILGSNYYTEDTYQQIFVYLENIGSKSDPLFAAPQSFTLSSNGEHGVGFVDLVDIDDDGDLDLSNTSYTYYYSYSPYINLNGFQTVYYENIGTPEEFEFLSAAFNPFNIARNTDESLTLIHTFGDIDMDGDYDILISAYSNFNELFNFRFQENIGSPTDPDFSDEVVFNPFGLSAGSYIIEIPQLVDFDFDGDLDVLSSRYDFATYSISITYYENTEISGINNLSDFGINLLLSPNPSFEYLSVQIEGIDPNERFQFQIVDQLGRVVAEEHFTDHSQKLDISNLSTGIYTARLINHQGQLSRKFVKVE